MGNGVKGCREVKEDECSIEAGVSKDEEVVGDFDEDSRSAVVRAKATLKGFIELMI